MNLQEEKKPQRDCEFTGTFLGNYTMKERSV